MDALSRLEPVARPLLAEVDAALATLGAPAEHPIWSLLRSLGATPADAVAHVAAVQPDPLLVAAGVLRGEAERYLDTKVPADVTWSGSSGEAYRVQIAALTNHLTGAGNGDRAGSGDGGRAGSGDRAGMLGRLEATASYLEQTAAWAVVARNRMAYALAEVLSSTQAVALRADPALSGGFEHLRSAGAAAPARSILAAADIGVHLLSAADDVLAEGRAVVDRWSGELTELGFLAPVHRSNRSDATLRLTT
jgi:hypothetical protein